MASTMVVAAADAPLQGSDEDAWDDLPGYLETPGRRVRMTASHCDGLPKNLVMPRTGSMRAMALPREGVALRLAGLAGAGRVPAAACAGLKSFLDFRVAARVLAAAQEGTPLG